MLDIINSIKSEVTLTRILIYNIRETNPDAVKFVVNESTVKSLLFALKIQSYDTILYSYGHLFLLELLKKFEELEKYEDCHLIITTILEHNKYTYDNLTTKIC